MKVTLNLEKRYAYAILAVLIIFGGIFVIQAYGITGGNPGHTTEEIPGAAVSCYSDLHDSAFQLYLPTLFRYSCNRTDVRLASTDTVKNETIQKRTVAWAAVAKYSESTAAPQCVLCELDTTNALASCGGKWTTYAGDFDTGSNYVFSLGKGCASYTPQKSNDRINLIDGVNYHFGQNTNGVVLCCRPNVVIGQQ